MRRGSPKRSQEASWLILDVFLEVKIQFYAHLWFREPVFKKRLVNVSQLDGGQLCIHASILLLMIKVSQSTRENLTRYRKIIINTFLLLFIKITVRLPFFSFKKKKHSFRISSYLYNFQR